MIMVGLIEVGYGCWWIRADDFGWFNWGWLWLLMD